MLDHYGLPLIEDEPYCELDYDGVPKPPISSMLQRAPWVFQGSFSKILMPGLRVGYLIAHPSLMPHLVRLKQAADLHTNRPGQWLALEYMRSADKLERLARLQAFYRERRDAFAAALEMGARTGSGFHHGLGLILLALLTMVVVLLALKTLGAARKGRICVPE